METAPTTTVERRLAARRQPAMGTIFRHDGAVPGLVWNISTGGLSLLVADPPERGTTVRGALATAVEAGLLEASAGTLEFRHALIGEAVVAGALPQDVHDAHRRAAEVLQSRGDDEPTVLERTEHQLFRTAAPNEHRDDVVERS